MFLLSSTLLLLLNLFSAHGTLVLPKFSWETVPVFVHMCNASGPFNESSLRYLARFPMITIEKGQGIHDTNPNTPPYVEDRILRVAKAIRAISPSAYIIYYMNTILDWTFYRLHPELVAHPSWQLHDKNGNVVLRHGDKSFPQPKDGMLVFDLAQQVVRNFWNSDCLNMTGTGFFQGCFADRADDNGFSQQLTKDQLAKFTEGHDLLMTQLQQTLIQRSQGIVIINDHRNIHVDGTKAVQIEAFRAEEASISLLMNYTASGWLVQVHAGYGQDGSDNHCKNITNSLAAFLIGAEKYCYFGCSTNWYIEPDWIVWHPQYNRPLGAPLGKAVKKGNVYYRGFASGTNVTFDVNTNTGSINWSS